MVNIIDVIEMNKIVYNNNLNVLKELENESVDLVYIDPTFLKSKKQNEINKYIKDLEIRIKEIHRILKSTGSIYVHTDYKTLRCVWEILDDVFGIDNFKNDIIWTYSGPINPNTKYFPRKHDTILFFTKTNNYTFNKPRIEHAGKLSVGGDTSWIGEKVNTTSYLKEGKRLEDWWIGIPALQRNEKEKLGYDTQKPEALLERIILASSNPNDIILDCYMGSGTTLAVAQKLERQFIGIDNSKEACEITAKRLNYKGKILTSFEEDYRDMHYYDYHEWVCNKMNGKYSKDDDCINCILDDNSLVMIKELKTNITPTMVRILISKVYEKDTRNGFIIAASFSNSVKKLVKEINNKGDLQIKLLTPEDI